MKRITLLLIISMVALIGFAQDNHPVSWKIDTVKIAPLTYELKITATVKEPWHVYTQNASNAGLAMPTQIIFEKNNNVELIGTTREKGIDQEEGETRSYYSKRVTFTQTLKLKSKEKTTLYLSIKYMACTNQMCLPPSSKQFIVALNNNFAGEKASLTLGGLPVGTKAPELKVEEWLSEVPDLKGKFVALDFWGPYCKPCIAGFPHINELHHKFKDKVVFIASTTNESPGDVYTFEAGTPIEFYSMMLKSKSLSDDYKIYGIPHMILVDPNGIVRFNGNGFNLTEAMLNDIITKYENE